MTSTLSKGPLLKSHLEEGFNVSRQTIWRDMTEAGMTAKLRPIIPWSGGDDAQWARERLKFARVLLQGKGANKLEMKRFLFSDESFFRVNDEGRWQWCRPDEMPEGRQKNKWTASSHVWGCIGTDGGKKKPFRHFSEKSVIL
jgi:hypothetical protein